MQHYKNISTATIHPINYLAIDILERLGLDMPDQSDIDLMESLILLSAEPNRLINSESFADKEVEVMRKFMEQQKKPRVFC